MNLNCTAHHMSFPVVDLPASRVFYEDILGLEEIERPDIFSIGGAWFAAGPCEVHLIELPAGAEVGTTPATCDPKARHAAFAVDNYEATVVYLKNAGLEVLETSPERGQCWVQDPDGHVIELIASKSEA